ncbi:MAG: hypothetical protein IT299_08765, partial [Dehalococcoidia bacterium]|nr:hypothetical protein [Dehalococcoidia bacterium]
MTKDASAMLTMVGVSHHEAPLEVRERLAVPADRIEDALAALTTRLGPAAILATCNRTEVYLSGDAPPEAVFALLETAAGFDARLARQYARV